MNRIIKFAFQDFSRNKGMSIAAIFVLLITITIVTGLLFFHGVTDYLVSTVQDKIDITAYFNEDVSEEDILAVKSEISEMSPNIRNIEYVSKEQALANFYELHKDDPVLARALEEVGDNPFLPSLNITTNGDPVQYESIANILQTSGFSDLVNKVDFSQKKNTIEKVYSITTNINTFGVLLGLALVLIAALVVFNTIKLVVENSRDEISTMKIVGASNWFVRGPFVIQGIIYGVIASFLCFLLFAILAYALAGKLAFVLPGFNMFSYFLTNWWIFVLLQLGFGVAVGAISATIAVKKYLDI